MDTKYIHLFNTENDRIEYYTDTDKYESPCVALAKDTNAVSYNKKGKVVVTYPDRSSSEVLIWDGDTFNAGACSDIVEDSWTGWVYAGYTVKNNGNVPVSVVEISCTNLNGETIVLHNIAGETSTVIEPGEEMVFHDNIVMNWDDFVRGYYTLTPDNIDIEILDDPSGEPIDVGTVPATTWSIECTNSDSAQG